MNSILREARSDHDPYDQFAWVQDWRFAICEALLFDWDHLVPGFQTAASEPEGTYQLEIIRSHYEIVDDSIAVEFWPVEGELKYALKVLDRYREWLALAGKDY